MAAPLQRLYKWRLALKKENAIEYTAAKYIWLESIVEVNPNFISSTFYCKSKQQQQQWHKVSIQYCKIN